MFEKKLNLDSIEFDTDGWETLKEERSLRMLGTPTGDIVRLALNQGAPNWPFDLTNEAAAQEFYENQSQELGGVMLSMEIGNYANVEVLNGVFKYRSPEPESLAMYFVGMSIIPFRHFNFQINVECVEKGTTGMREAAVHAILATKGQLPEIEDAESEPIDSMDDFFDKIRTAKLRVMASDDPEYDSGFPNHALTIVRDTQFHVLDTLTVPDWVAAKPKPRL